MAAMVSGHSAVLFRVRDGVHTFGDYRNPAATVAAAVLG